MCGEKFSSQFSEEYKARVDQPHPLARPGRWSVIYTGRNPNERDVGEAPNGYATRDEAEARRLQAGKWGVLADWAVLPPAEQYGDHDASRLSHDQLVRLGNAVLNNDSATYEVLRQEFADATRGRAPGAAVTYGVFYRSFDESWVRSGNTGLKDGLKNKTFGSEAEAQAALEKYRSTNMEYAVFPLSADGSRWEGVAPPAPPAPAPAFVVSFPSRAAAAEALVAFLQDAVGSAGNAGSFLDLDEGPGDQAEFAIENHDWSVRGEKLAGMNAVAPEDYGSVDYLRDLVRAYHAAPEAAGAAPDGGLTGWDVTPAQRVRAAEATVVDGLVSALDTRGSRGDGRLCLSASRTNALADLVEAALTARDDASKG